MAAFHRGQKPNQPSAPRLNANDALGRAWAHSCPDSIFHAMTARRDGSLPPEPLHVLRTRFPAFCSSFILKRKSGHRFWWNRARLSQEMGPAAASDHSGQIVLDTAGENRLGELAILRLPLPHRFAVSHNSCGLPTNSTQSCPTLPEQLEDSSAPSRG
jgi:hypothetical protein